MNVVIRGLMAAGMTVYAAMHALQAVRPPEDAPGWLVVAFALTALGAVTIAGGLILGAERAENRWEDAAALLALPSLVALVLSYTTGFVGASETDVRADTAIVFVAELVVLTAWVVSRFTTRETAEVDEEVPTG